VWWRREKRLKSESSLRVLNNDARDVNQDGRRQYRTSNSVIIFYGLTSVNCDGVIYFLW
jgi:hypothetical protein